MAQMKRTFRPGMIVPIGSFQWRILDVDSEARITRSMQGLIMKNGVRSPGKPVL